MMKLHNYLILGLLIAAPLTHATVLEKKEIDLGYINGKVLNKKTIEINETLQNPVLFSIDDPKIAQQVQLLKLENVQVIKAEDKALTVFLNIMIGDVSHSAQTTFKLEINGHPELISYQEIRGDLYINLPTKYNSLSLVATKPMKIELPITYRGPFNMNMHIEGLSQRDVL